MKSIILIAGLTFGLAALAAETGVELYQKAVTQEKANGNLEEAIKLYQRVAKEFASDRALAAKALMAAAHCYELQGQSKQDKAIELYNQVARQYKDQVQPAATANAKLAALQQANLAAEPAAPRQTKIEIAGAVNGGFYTDGQRVVYRDEASKALVVGDLAGRNKSVVYKPKLDELFLFVPSRDLSMVYLRVAAPGGKPTHAVIKIDGTDYRELFQGDPYGIVPAPSWSWDNRNLLFSSLALTADPDTGAFVNRLAVVSVSDGKGREVLQRSFSSVAVRPNAVPATFSPDGRFIAFSESNAQAGWTGKTYVVGVQGGEPKLISGEVNFLDWTRDGRYLVVSSTRSGSVALWLFPVKDGRPSGDPVFVRNGDLVASLQMLFPGGILPNGALLYRTPRHSVEATLGTFDSNGRLGAWKPLDLNIGGNNFYSDMRWSADSTQIAYPSAHADAGQLGSSFRVRNLVSGEDREVYRSAANPISCEWEAHRPNLICVEGPGAGERETILVALDSGRTERLGRYSPPETLMQFVREKGIEIIIPRGTLNTLPYGVPNPNPLTQLVNKRDVEIRPDPDSDWKHLLSLNEEWPSFSHAWSFDSKWIFYGDKDAAGKDGLFRISSAGGEPERLGDLPAQYGITLRLTFNAAVHISPDGRNILIEAPNNRGSAYETWLLENFEPKAPAAK
jgi:Tol biopolymer transport system component